MGDARREGARRLLLLAAVAAGCASGAPSTLAPPGSLTVAPPAAVASSSAVARAAESPGPASPPSDPGDLQPPLPDVEGPPPLEPPDRTQPPWSQTVVPPIAEGEVREERLEGGRHLRLGTAHGSVHVWLPDGYARRRAGVVLYVHGYYTDVDQAFADHALARQFHRSGRNAMFVVPEAPAWNGDPVSWPDLDALLAEVTARTGLPVPAGPLVAAGHSGAIRTLLAWLPHPRVEEVLLLDALYRGEDELETWLHGAPTGKRRVVLVGQETAMRTEAWLRAAHPRVVRHGHVPAQVAPIDRRAPVVYYRARTTHMEIVTGGRMLPLLLRATRAPALVPATAGTSAPAPAAATAPAAPR